MVKAVKRITTVLLCILAIAAGAQNTRVQYEDDVLFKDALKLFEKEKFGAAQKIFTEIIEKYSSVRNETHGAAEYYRAVCAIELFNPDAEYLITKFLDEFPESPYAIRARYDMAKFKYRDQAYPEAVYWFALVYEYDVPKDEKTEYQFKYAYSLFEVANYEAAKPLFKQVMETDNMYRTPALYYYSHLAYLDKNYETAYRGFEELRADPKFEPIVPYYLTQILYEQKKYDKIIEFAPQFLDSASTKRQPEISRILGEAYYQTGDFEKALPYFEKYDSTATSFTKDDYYSLGYVFYRTGKYEKAAVKLEKVTGENDTIAQNAYYHLADCYVHMGDKTKARNAFFAASNKPVNPDITEDAQFCYAKLTYELSYSPFNETITAFEEFIAKYPASKKVDDAYTFLVKVYMTSKNYKDALASLDKIKRRSADMDMAYQRVAYFRGLELFNNLDFEDAVIMFDKSLQFGIYDKDVKAMSYYWKAEALFRLQKYSEGQAAFSLFIVSPGAINKPEYKLAHYDLGYAYFKLKDYPAATTWFRKYTDMSAKDKMIQYADACNRVGDCYFMQREYDKANMYYKRAYDEKKIDADYALFQQGFCCGLLKNADKKISFLQQLLREYPLSAYADDAAFELGQGHISKDEYMLAEPYYKRIVDEFPNSSYVKRSYLQLGIIYFSENQFEKASDVYKKVIQEYAGSEESKSALVGLKNIYISKNKVDEYVAYVETLGDFAKVTQTGQDSLNYLAAEDAYMRGDFKVARSLFDKYLQRYPDGIFALNGHFYRSDCYAQDQIFDSAMVGYRFIIGKPKNSFTEQTLLYAAKLAYKQKDYESSAKYYTKLETLAELKSNMLIAREGQMEAYEKLKQHKECINAAERLISTDKVSEEQVRAANFTMGKSYIAQLDTANALIRFRTLALDVSSLEGAQSKYLVARILFEQHRYDEAEAEVTSFLDQGSPHQLWLGKSYIIWGDIFYAREDFFQAKYTYQSILENYPVKDDGVMATAREHHAKAVKTEEQRLNQPKAPLQIDFYDSGSESLFENTNK